MKYIIHEYQTDAEGNTIIVAPEQRNDYYEAESVFYYKMSFAAVSNKAKHTVKMETNEGETLLVKCYTAEEKAAKRALDNPPPPEPEQPAEEEPTEEEAGDGE